MNKLTGQDIHKAFITITVGDAEHIRLMKESGISPGNIDWESVSPISKEQYEKMAEILNQKLEA